MPGVSVPSFRSIQRCPATPCSTSTALSQQGLQLCVIIRMSAEVVSGIMFFELVFEGILETGGSLKQPVLLGSDTVQTRICWPICHSPERKQHVTSSKIVL